MTSLRQYEYVRVYHARKKNSRDTRAIVTSPNNQVIDVDLETLAFPNECFLISPDRSGRSLKHRKTSYLTGELFRPDTRVQLYRPVTRTIYGSPEIVSLSHTMSAKEYLAFDRECQRSGNRDPILRSELLKLVALSNQ